MTNSQGTGNSPAPWPTSWVYEIQTEHIHD